MRNTNVDRAVQNVEQTLPRSPERGQILDFIRNSPEVRTAYLGEGH